MIYSILQHGAHHVHDKLAKISTDKFHMPSKLHIILFVTWIYSYCALQAALVFEALFRFMLFIPNEWNFILSKKHINVLTARNEHMDITNKMQLFLNWYWQKGWDESGGFDIEQYKRLFNSTVLYIEYSLKNNNNLESVYNDVYNYIINIDTSEYKNIDESESTQILFNHVDLEQS